MVLIVHDLLDNHGILVPMGVFDMVLQALIAMPHLSSLGAPKPTRRVVAKSTLQVW
jgi:hypothetical protein